MSKPPPYVFTDAGKREPLTADEVAHLATEIVELVIQKCGPRDAALTMAAALRLFAEILKGALGDRTEALWSWACDVVGLLTIDKERISLDAPDGAPDDPFELPDDAPDSDPFALPDKKKN